jgi:hypothetical protein
MHIQNLVNFWQFNILCHKKEIKKEASALVWLMVTLLVVVGTLIIGMQQNITVQV